MSKDLRVYLAQILECTERISAYAAGGKETFLTDRMTQDAVIRNFQVIGEAAKRVPEEYRQAHREIPWRGLAAFRDVLIHRYEAVDPLAVWQVIEGQLPELRDAIRAALPPLEQLEAELAGEAGDASEPS